MGVPGGIFAALIGLTGSIMSIIDSNWMSLTFSAALFFLGGPMARVTMMVHKALDQIEELKAKQ